MNRFLLILLALFVSLGTANAQTFPALSGRVVDQADLLSPAEEAALTAKLQALETQSDRQLVVATLSSLEGYEISDYGYQLGPQMGNWHRMARAKRRRIMARS